ncbi:MAG: phosphodiester glycosidase family protein [Myxococcota bacterium]|nr:phosphodiester glycosidase family protein [Myxococcota bacterium]
MIRSMFISVLFLCTSACTSPQAEIAVIKHIQRHRQTEHVEYVRLDIHSEGRSIGYLHAVYAHPENINLTLGLNPERKSIRQTFPSALLVANAGFFTDTWKPTGLLRHSGRSLSPLITKGGAAGSGVFLVTDNIPRLVERERITRQEVQKSSFAIQAGPRIIEPNGQPGIRSDDGKRRNRTLIGVSEKGLLVVASFIAHPNGGRGLSLFQLQELLTKRLREESHTAKYALSSALNLDGGPSSSFIFRGKKQNIEVAGSNKVLSIIALEVK